MRYSAAFLDRDGTLIRDDGYIDDPADVELIPGAPQAVALLNARSIPVAVVTNQSGIGRGYYSEADYRAVADVVERRLAMRGCALDAVHHCPHAPEEECGCRKPEIGMHRRAAERLGVDLGSALYVGDKVRDVEPALRTGGTGYLLRTGSRHDPREVPEGVHVADDLLHAVTRALGVASGSADA